MWDKNFWCKDYDIWDGVWDDIWIIDGRYED